MEGFPWLQQLWAKPTYHEVLKSAFSLWGVNKTQVTRFLTALTATWLFQG